MLVIFYDKRAPLRTVLEEFGARPVNAIEGLEAGDEPLAAASAQIS